MTLDDITNVAAALHLVPLGGLHDGGKTTILLGPKEPGFWAYVRQRPEFLTGGDDPLDAWSHWAITALGYVTGAQPVFPFGGPPFHPFITWALQSGEIWQSPVGLLVHKDAGLLVSFRGALVFDVHIELSPPAENPCDSCADKPCLTACPVDALSPHGYDVPKCKEHINVDPVCGGGCRVRLACPISQSYPRDPAQTAFHMRAFHHEATDAT